MEKPSIKNAFALFILFLFVTGCNSPANKNSDRDKPPLITIGAVTVTRADMVDSVSIYGSVHLRKETRLGSQFSGRLDDFSLLPGDPVKKGRRIGTIIPPTREALLQVLDDMPAASRPALEKQIKTIPLFSSLDGIVLKVMRHTGDVVQAGEQIVHIGDLRVLDIRGDLPIRYLPTIRKTKKITVTFIDYPRDPLVLSLAAVSGQINRDSQTAMIRLKLTNPAQEFRPGMLVKLSFAGNKRPAALIIPRQALLEEEGVYSAFILKGNRVEKRLVKPGIIQGNLVEILSGVQENEKVITEKAYSLEDGMEVEVRLK